jgi:hypothetical protein
MNVIDLTPFGLNCRFHYHGRIKAQRQAGARLLFLFNEKRRNDGSYEMKRLNLLNACELCQQGVVGLVAVEECLTDERWPTAEEAAALVRAHGSFEGAVEHLYRHNPDNKFSTVLRRVFPQIPIRCVEDPDLRQQTEELYRHCLAVSHIEELRSLPQYDFDNHPIHLERDTELVRRLFACWEEIGPGKAAILNAGRDHQDRIGAQLPDDVRFIQMETEDGQ